MFALRRVAASIFIAWFMAVSVLATATTATLLKAKQLAAAQATQLAPTVGMAGCQSGGEAVARDAAAGGGATADGAAEDGATADPSPGDETCDFALTPPGDDVPPDLDFDLETEPGYLTTELEWPVLSATELSFVTTVQAHEPHVPESTSPPPRA